jgi:TolB protein
MIALFRLAAALVGVALMLMVGILYPLRDEAVAWLPFTAWELENRATYLVGEGGGGIKYAARPVDLATFPQWSPHSRWVTFTAHREVDKPSQQPDAMRGLNSRLSINGWPRWSPDGRWVALVSYQTGSSALYRTRPDGSDARLLVISPGINSLDWSPDSQWLVFVMRRLDISGIFRVNLDGSSLQFLTSKGGQPAWSPDGQWIAYVASDESHLTQVFRLRADGRDIQQLTRLPANCFTPLWSPDGEWVVFATIAPTGSTIYRMRADGSGLQPLSDDFSGTVQWLGWSPDDEWLAFVSRRGGKLGAYRLRLEGGAAQLISDEYETQADFAWLALREMPWNPGRMKMLGVLLLGVGAGTALGARGKGGLATRPENSR